MITVKANFNYKDLTKITNALNGLRSFVSDYVYARDVSVIRKVKSHAIDYIYSKVKMRNNNLGDGLIIDSNKGMGGARYDIYFDQRIAPHADTHIGREGSYATIVSTNLMVYNVKEHYGSKYRVGKSPSLKSRKIKGADDSGWRRSHMVRVKRSISWSKLTNQMENDLAEGLVELANKGINVFMRKNG